MEIQFKETVWNSVNIDDCIADEVLEKLKNNEITSREDLKSQYRSSYSCVESNSENEQMQIEQNFNQPTIIALSDSSNELYTNLED